MILFLKGIIIGIGKIIPGVSGSLLAIRLNVYEMLVYSVNNLFKNFKTNALFLFKLGIGILLSIVLGSRIIIYLMDNYYLLTKIVFLLLIMSGIPMVLKETNSYLISIITCFLYLAIINIKCISTTNNYFIIGFIEAFCTIVPGISGTALFMSFGLYDDLLLAFSNIHKLNISILLPFSLGLIIGAFIIFRFIEYCLNKYKNKTYGVILGLLISSIILMILKKQ